MKSFVEVALPDVFKLLARRIGLNPDSVGLALIQAAVNDHMDELGLDDATAYVERLHGSGEFDELVERVVVPETWFFRDLEPYRFLQHFVRERWRPRHPGERLRVLSVPCSTGEESYSIAITLLDLGWSPERFRVDGVDISRVGIQKARTGSFGANSFREKTAIVSRPLDSFFRQHGEKRVVCDEARAAARFTRANLADLEFLPDVTPYDVIYCRNLLIYLVPEARERALAHFNRLLQPGGFVYLGHAESGVASAARLEVEDDSFPFAFRFGSPVDPSSPTELLTPATMSRSGEFFKLPFQPLVTDISSPTATPRDHSPPPVAAPVDADSTRRAVPRIPPAAPIVEPRRPSATPKPAPPPRRHAARSAAAPVNSSPPNRPSTDSDLLTQARAAANAGRLDEAAQHCQRLLAETAPLAEAYCLLGTIRQAQGDFAAAEPFFQKAVYLEPNHHESLVHLSLLAQRKGDANAAANFRRRAERAAKGGE